MPERERPINRNAAQPSPALPPIPVAPTFNRPIDWAWRLLPLLLLLTLGAACTFVNEPLIRTIQSISPGCLFRRLTGLACPGCGGTRALCALLRGEISEALHHNWLWLPTGLILLEEYLLSWWLWLHPEHEQLRFARPRLIGLKLYALIVILWFILRNILGI